jgi:hypothetical protein
MESGFPYTYTFNIMCVVHKMYDLKIDLIVMYIQIYILLKKKDFLGNIQHPGYMCLGFTCF